MGRTIVLASALAACSVQAPPREPCESDRDCARGQSCRSGRCEVYPRPKGMPCDRPEDCQSALCHRSTCRQPCAGGVCAEDEFCEVDVCLPKRASHAPCGRDVECQSGLCLGDVCRTPCAGVDDSPCAATEFCEKGLCSPAQAAGVTCNRNRACVSGHCVESLCRASCPGGSDAECSPTEYCEINVCAPRLPAGRECLRGAQCRSGLCQGQICRAAACEGEDDDPCAGGEYCGGHLCSPALGAGAACNRPRMCASLACIASRCRSLCQGTDDAACATGEYCDGARCVPALAAGAECAREAQCESRICGAGRCRADCFGTDDSSCAQDEYCDGARCVPTLPPGAPCAVPRQCTSENCVGGLCRAVCPGGEADCAAAEYCAGGACAPVKEAGLPCQGGTECATALCIEGLCRATCSGAQDFLCARSEYCDGARCVPLLGDGLACARSTQCESGWCIEARCRAACTGAEDAACAAGEYCTGLWCAPRKVDGAVCTRSAECLSLVCVAALCRAGCASGGDAACAAGEYCDGERCVPQLPNGAPCTRKAECSRGSCSGGFCSASCAGAGDAACPSMEFCDGTSCVPRLATGMTCDRAQQCQSGACTDGLCCAEVCAICQRCDLDPKGTCQNSPLDAADPRCPASPPSGCGLSGLCDGAGRCALWGAGTVCRESACTGFSLNEPAACDGAGQCLPGADLPCEPYACATTTCLATCTLDAHCAPGYRCDMGACRLLGIAVTAGGGAADGAAATVANLKRPVKMAIARESGVDVLYVADEGAHRVRRVNLATGVISTAAGTGMPGFSGDEGPAVEARLSGPAGVALLLNGKLLVADSGNHRIRIVNQGGKISAFAGTGVAGFGGDGAPATLAQLDSPRGLAVEASGDLLISDTGNHRVRRVDQDEIITTVAGTGVPGYSGEGDVPTSAQLSRPDGLSASASGAILIADRDNQRVRSIAGNMILTAAGTGSAGFNGDGAALATELNFPAGVFWEGSGWLLADTSNHRIRAVPGANVVTIAGTGVPGFSGDGAPAQSAQISGPMDVAADANGNRYLADTDNRRIRVIEAASGNISTIAGNGYASYSGDGLAPTQAALGIAGGIAFGADGALYIAQKNAHVVRRASGGTMTTIAGSATLGAGCSGNGVPATTAQLNDPGGLAVLGADVYLADTGCHVVRRISGGMVTVVAGTLGVPGYAGEDVPATSALLDSPRAVAVDASENLYIADTNNHRVRVVSAATSRIQTFAGDGRTGFGGEGGPAVSATLPSPLAVGVDAQGNVYIADGENRRIRRVSAATLHIRTVVGNGRDVYSGDGLLGREASVGTVKGLALDAAGNLYFSAPMNLRVLVLSVVDGRVYTLAGNGSAGIPDGGAQARASPLLEPRDVAWDPTAMRLSFVDGFEGSDAPESRVLRLE